MHGWYSYKVFLLQALLRCSVANARREKKNKVEHIHPPLVGRTPPRTWQAARSSIRISALQSKRTQAPESVARLTCAEGRMVQLMPPVTKWAGPVGESDRLQNNVAKMEKSQKTGPGWKEMRLPIHSQQPSLQPLTPQAVLDALSGMLNITASSRCLLGCAVAPFSVSFEVYFSPLWPSVLELL